MSEEAVVNTGEEVSAAPEAAPEASTPVSMTGEDGNWNPDYLKSLPDKLGEHSNFERYKNPEEFFKGGVNAHKLAVGKAEEFWASDDPDNIAKRQEIMGVPNDATEYAFEPVEWTEGMPVDVINEHYEEAKSVFKELNISKEQAAGLIAWDSKNAIAQFAKQNDAREQQKTEAIDALRKEWPGEKYEYNIEKTKNAIEHLNGSDVVNNENWGNDPAFIKWAHENIVPLISNDEIIESRAVENNATMQDSYDAQWEKMDKMEQGDPNYNREVEKMRKIVEKMDGQLK